MRRFVFPFERLLAAKRQIERQAELEHHRARQAAEIARARLRDLNEQLARAADRLTASVGRPVAADQWAADAALSERLGQSIRAAEQAATTAGLAEEAAAQKRSRVATEVEALATLRRGQWDAWREKAESVAQARLDEVGMRRWAAARDEATGPGPTP